MSARLGFLFDEETSNWIQVLADLCGKEPHEFLRDSVKVMVNAYMKDSNG